MHFLEQKLEALCADPEVAARLALIAPSIAAGVAEARGVRQKPLQVLLRSKGNAAKHVFDVDAAAIRGAWRR